MRREVKFSAYAGSFIALFVLIFRNSLSGKASFLRLSINLQ
jgi:hypothetical protein